MKVTLYLNETNTQAADRTDFERICEMLENVVKEHGYKVEIIEADDPLIAVKRKQGLVADWQRFGIYFSEDLGRSMDQELVNAIEAIINPEY